MVNLFGLIRIFRFMTESLEISAIHRRSLLGGAVLATLCLPSAQAAHSFSRAEYDVLIEQGEAADRPGRGLDGIAVLMPEMEIDIKLDADQRRFDFQGVRYEIMGIDSGGMLPIRGVGVVGRSISDGQQVCQDFELLPVLASAKEISLECGTLARLKLRRSSDEFSSQASGKGQIGEDGAIRKGAASIDASIEQSATRRAE